MAYFLSQLDNSLPCVRSECFSSFIALQIFLNKSHHDTLLHNGVVEDFLVDRDFYLHSLGVRLGPDELRAENAHSFGNADLLQKHGEHFFGLSLEVAPG